MSSRAIPAACLAASLTVSFPAPVSAHALHGDVDAPLPFAAYILGAAIAVTLSFVFIAITDGAAAAAEGGGGADPATCGTYAAPAGRAGRLALGGSAGHRRR
jgi:hypothetical protein